MKFKQVHLSPMRIPPQQEAARRLVALMRMREVRVATYLNDLIKRNQPSEKYRNENEPTGPCPVEPALAEVE